jgi:GNAT superfamily N-acetyltransferase
VARGENKDDDSVWTVTCFVVRAGFQGRGLTRVLVRAAVEFARERGARALEGYPMITEPGQEITWGETTSAPAASSRPRGSSRPTGRRCGGS